MIEKYYSSAGWGAMFVVGDERRGRSGPGRAGRSSCSSQGTVSPHRPLYTLHSPANNKEAPSGGGAAALQFLP